MTGYQPPEEEIAMFMACIPGVDRREVIARIKGNSNNVESAINEYFESPNASKYQWVDGHFADGRDGEYVPGNVPSFNIHSPDEMPHEVREPQTRPPSRTTNNRSPMNVIDLTNEHANADPRNSMAHDDDSELQRALQQSLVEAGLPPQQSGITSTVTHTQTVHFGPATQNEYEEKSWGMVSVGKAREILLDPEPAARKRDLNVPAFLKPTVEDNRLNALFTIYHEIPLLREVFMNRSDVQASYGLDNEWWTGKAIEVPYITGSEPDDGQQMLYEIQRLMAFLDKTDRSYGSAETLANLHAVQRQQSLNIQTGSSSDIETAIWTAWRKVFKSRETGHVSKVFSVGVDNEEKKQVTEFAILELPLPGKTSSLETFYDIADEALWPFDATNTGNSAYLDHIADVITFRLKEVDPANPMDVPAVWYPDRYMESSRQAALDMRIQRAKVVEKMRTIASLQESLTTTVVRGKMIKVQDLFSAALQHDVDQVNGQDYSDQDESAFSDERTNSNVSSEKSAKLSAELNKVMASIDKKLEALNLEKEKAKDTFREVSKLYTEPSSDPNEPPTHEYTLRGVSTTKSTMYIRRKAEIDLIDMELSTDAPLTDDDQWWKIMYSSSGSITVEKKTEEEVLEAAKTESKDIYLVYASVKAMQFESKSLPLPLEKFVRDDNQFFQAELSMESDSGSQVTSPGKRKWNDSSEDSQESERWIGASSPKGYENNSVQAKDRELGYTDSGFNMASARAASQMLADRMDDSRTVTPGDDEHEVIHGVDPMLEDSSFSGQEMQERSNMPMLSASSTRAKTIDSMDLDQVVEDEHGAKESAAVRDLGMG